MSNKEEDLIRNGVVRIAELELQVSEMTNRIHVLEREREELYEFVPKKIDPEQFWVEGVSFWRCFCGCIVSSANEEVYCNACRAEINWPRSEWWY